MPEETVSAEPIRSEREAELTEFVRRWRVIHKSLAAESADYDMGFVEEADALFRRLGLEVIR